MGGSVSESFWDCRQTVEGIEYEVCEEGELGQPTGYLKEVRFFLKDAQRSCMSGIPGNIILGILGKEFMHVPISSLKFLPVSENSFSIRHYSR